jgi:hypothetical protein
VSISPTCICRNSAYAAADAFWRPQPNLMLGIITAAVVMVHADRLEP